MYNWRDQFEPRERDLKAAPQSREARLERENKRLKQSLADKTLELDFFKGALQKVEARRRQSKNSGGKTSTTTSGK
jgi:hypothetical protein